MSERILIVDDEPDAAALVAELLRAAGYETETATGGRAALRLAAAGRFDLVVLDVMMAYPSEGLDVARTLRAGSGTSRVPILILSGADAGWRMREQIPERDLPCDAFLDKPVERERLLTAVREVLAAPRADRWALVVEDEPDFAAYLAELLTAAGLRAATAVDLGAAEKLLAAGTPDLVTLDLELAHGSGGDLYHRLRSDPALRQVPVVVVTGLPLDHPEVQALRRQLTDDQSLPLPDAYLEKPVRPDELRRVLADLRPPAAPATA